MRLRTSWLVALVLALPAPAFGQTTPSREALIGAWVMVHGQAGRFVVDLLTLNADGSYSQERKRQEGDSLVAVAQKKTGEEPNGWRVTGDTLRLGDDANVEFRGRPTGNPYPNTYIFRLKDDGRLVLWEWLMWDVGRRHEKCALRVLERFDPSKPLPLPPPARTTVDPADLVGTWAGTFDSKFWGIVTDTLVIGPDYTLRSEHLGPVDDAYEKGMWALLPGDVLTGPLGNKQRAKVYLQNGELLRCLASYAPLKRVAP